MRGDLRYCADDDCVGCSETFARLTDARVDAYRVSTAVWEPLVEPGLELVLARERTTAQHYLRRAASRVVVASETRARGVSTERVNLKIES